MKSKLKRIEEMVGKQNKAEMAAGTFSYSVPQDAQDSLMNEINKLRNENKEI